MVGRSTAVDTESVNKWISDKWPDSMPSDIYNTDETVQFWHLLPSRTLVHRNEKCHGSKLNKVHITILLAKNKDGSSKLTRKTL